MPTKHYSFSSHDYLFKYTYEYTVSTKLTIATDARYTTVVVLDICWNFQDESVWL